MVDNESALPDKSLDRFVSNYVFDLLPKTAMKEIVDTLKQKMKKEGKICLVSLTDQIDAKEQPLAQVVLNGWHTVTRFCKICLGGCRPIDLNYPFAVQHTMYEVTHQEVLVRWGIPSQVVVATRRKFKPHV